MNICRLSAAVCLLFLLFAGSVYTEHGSFHVEEELGADLCPECKLLGKVQLEPTKVELDLVPVEPTAPLIQDEDLGAEICTEKVVSYVIPSRKPSTDSSDTDSYGVDMCPEKGQAMGSSVERQDLGAEICTEKVVSYVIPSRKPSADSSDTDSYGVDMCPEKGQPMGSSVERQDLGAEICTEKTAGIVEGTTGTVDPLEEFIQHLRSRSIGDLHFVEISLVVVNTRTS
ncbi:hypothetical protein R1sor_002713 [Riccia sorocarpa]|uniref:Uncharacterized protein n=1 Tax=Riccia sorocarpa TaxID=122646 RepID=A0ABD3H1P3_9MARC